ncbi:hypothetical protein FHS92_002656 [Sphingobium subterraneum]|uniref:Rap1a immunity protein domain-containing protein n=2 Tax=Sphingobium subterraneum TaxID=627688 RepID=A0A841J1T3_9SPHN|nr:hypothetical protein [Sphingobium subterraneum]
MRYLIAMIAIGASAVIAPSTRLNAEQYVTGAGAQSCADFVRQAGKDGLSDPASLQWALGYITGRTTATNAWHRPFTGPEGIALDLLSYCRAHPVRQIDDAAASFFERTRYCKTKHGCR